MAAQPKTMQWVSSGGHKHQVSTATGRAPCGLTFANPLPACNRADPICKECMGAMRRA